MKKSKKITIIIIGIVLAFIIFFVSCFFILTTLGKHQFHKEDAHISADEVTIEDNSTISYKGKEYTLNKNVISVLVMGIDRNNINQNLGIGKNGQADVIFVATINTKTKKTTIIPISRETLVDVSLYTSDGGYAGTKKEQLCLAYAYGSSPEECSENVITSVKRLFYGINISSYVTIELDGISLLTDMVGGIEITSIENISAIPLTIREGEKATLNGKEANYYIRYRGDDVESNNRRMQRQKQFLSALMNKTGNAVMSDFSNLATFYNKLSPYFSTNVSFAQITYLAQNCLTMNFGDSIEYKTITGTLSQVENWVEFEADEESVLQTIIDTFYIPKTNSK